MKLTELQTPGLSLELDKHDDKLVYAIVNGKRYAYKPKDPKLSAKDLHMKAKKMATFSTGKALAFLKANAIGGLNEAKLQGYQVKVLGDWHDLKLPAKSLEELADEFSDKPNNHQGMAPDSLPIIHKLVSSMYLDHGGAYYLVDEDYDVVSLKDDVLKVNYGFMLHEKGKSHVAKKSGQLTIMPMVGLQEAAEEKEVKPMPYVDKIAKLLFGEKGGPVVDKKRSKLPKYYGVAHSRSKLLSEKGKSIFLTFDNSTDSGEFEINSLTPLKIEKGGELDKSIRALYKKHKVPSQKRTNYIDVDGTPVMREIHLGQDPDDRAIKLVKDVLKLLKGETLEDEPDEKKAD